MASFIIGITIGITIGMGGVLMAVITSDKKTVNKNRLDLFMWLC